MRFWKCFRCGARCFPICVGPDMRGALDIDLDRTYDEKLWIAEIRLIRSQSHSIIERVDKPPFDQYVCTAEQLYILEKLKEYLVPEQEAGAGVNTGETAGAHRRCGASGSRKAHEFQRRI